MTVNSTRDQILQTTAQLLETQGYHATGLNQIVAESGAPKGSLYYYFPDGKEGLTAEAIEKTGRMFGEHIKVWLEQVADPADAIAAFVHGVAEHVMASSCRGGSAITIVALETASTSERLNETCRQTYQLWQDAFAAKLAKSGFGEARAQQLATLIVAALEGGIVLSRTQRSALPLERVAEELRQLLRATNRQ